MKHTITLIPGDGIGPEIVAATVRVIEATGVEIDWETHILGAQAQEKFGTTLPEETIDSIRLYDRPPFAHEPGYAAYMLWAASHLAKLKG